MRFRIPRGVCAALAGLVALGMAGSGSFAAPPGPNSDVAGAPPRASDGPAALTITVRTCPPGFDPAEAGADPLVACREPAGDTSFALSRGDLAGPSASTGTSGDAPQQSTVMFTNMEPGRYRLAATAPAEIAGAFVWRCDSSAREIASPFTPLAWVGPDGALAVELLPGESLSCDWFQVRSAG